MGPKGTDPHGIAGSACFNLLDVHSRKSVIKHEDAASQLHSPCSPFSTSALKYILQDLRIDFLKLSFETLLVLLETQPLQSPLPHFAPNRVYTTLEQLDVLRRPAANCGFHIAKP